MGKDAYSKHFENHYYGRIRTVRSKIRIRKTHSDKQLRALYIKENELYQQIRETPWVPLEKPYQKGYVRYFVLRDDLVNTPDAHFFENLLEKINTFQYSDTRKFTKRKRKFGKRIYVERPQYLCHIYTHQWNCPKMGLSEREKLYFIRTTVYNPQTKCEQTYYQFTDTWRFRLKVTPHYITHYKPVNVELQSQVTRIDNYFEKNNLRKRLQRLISGGRRYFYKKPEHNPLKNITKSELYSQYKTDYGK